MYSCISSHAVAGLFQSRASSAHTQCFVLMSLSIGNFDLLIDEHEDSKDDCFIIRAYC